LAYSFEVMVEMEVTIIIHVEDHSNMAWMDTMLMPTSSDQDWQHIGDLLGGGLAASVVLLLSGGHQQWRGSIPDLVGGG
jgi:hypothetical protein